MKTTLAVVALLLAYAYTSAEDVSDEQPELEFYCEMVELNKSDPEVGWPDFKGLANTECAALQQRGQ